MDLKAMDPGQWIRGRESGAVDRGQGMGALNQGQWIGAVDRGSGWGRSGSKALDKDTETEQRAPDLKILNRNRSRAGMKSQAGSDKGGSKYQYLSMPRREKC